MIRQITRVQVLDAWRDENEGPDPFERLFTVSADDVFADDVVFNRDADLFIQL